MRRVCLLLLVLAACGPAPGYNAEGQYVADPNAGLASPRRDGPTDPEVYPQQQQAGQPASSGGQQAAPQGTFYDDMASASGQPPQQPQTAPCDDTCRFANNGECDDGREGSDTDVCGAGTDCADCGR